MQYQGKKKKEKKYSDLVHTFKTVSLKYLFRFINKGSPYVILKVLCLTEQLYAERKIPAKTVEQQ